nr:serine/threonine-protein kinase [uncultured Cohaesibacter sp.]
MNDRNALSPGTLLHQYRIDSVIGQGGFGITYLAFDTDLQRKVAIKECYPQGFVERSGTTIVATSSTTEKDFGWALDKFVEEATTLARFKHPGIVQVLQILKRENNSAYMVLEFIEGQSLDAWLNSRSGPPTEQELRKVIEPIFDALEVVHENGIAHRDIAPDNIFIRTNGEAVLLDFGTAKQIVGHQTRTMNLVVKDGYSAPEQYYEKGKQGPWTDIYAFASTLYRAIAGKRPVDAIARQDALHNEEDDPLVPLSDIAPKGYSKSFLDAIHLGMTPQVKLRPKDLHEWRAVLLDGTVPNISPQLPDADKTHLFKGSENASPQNSHKKPPLLFKGFVALLGLAVMAAGGGYWYINRVKPAATTTLTTSVTENPATTKKATPQRPVSSDRQDSIQTPPKASSLASDLAKKKKQEEDRQKALILKEADDWKRASLEDTEGAYSRYLRAHPDTSRSNDIDKALLALASPWARTLSGQNSETAYAVATNKDTIAVAGAMAKLGHATTGLIYSLSQSGKQRWRKEINHEGSSVIEDILIAHNEDVVAVGHFHKSGSNVVNAFALRYSKSGDLVWKVNMGSSSFSSFNTIDEMPNNDLILAGSVFSGKTNGRDGWFMRLSSSGQILAERSLGGAGDDTFLGAKTLPTGEIALVGKRQKPERGDSEFWLLKLSTTGQTLWERIAGGSASDQYNAVAARSDGQFFAAGETTSLGTGAIDAMITRVARDNRMHPKPIMHKLDDILTSIATTHDGGVIVGGYTASKGAGKTDGWLTKYDASLKTVLWERVIGGSDAEKIEAIEVISDDSVVASGTVEGDSPDDMSIWLVKLGADGRYQTGQQTHLVSN